MANGGLFFDVGQRGFVVVDAELGHIEIEVYMAVVNMDAVKSGKEALTDGMNVEFASGFSPLVKNEAIDDDYVSGSLSGFNKFLSFKEFYGGIAEVFGRGNLKPFGLGIYLGPRQIEVGDLPGQTGGIHGAQISEDDDGELLLGEAQKSGFITNEGAAVSDGVEAFIIAKG